MRAVFYNGVYSDFDSLKIPLYDRAIFFGDGVYDVVIGQGGNFFLLDEHLDRFYKNIERIGLDAYCKRDELIKIAEGLIDLSKEESYMLYMQASGFSKTRIHARPSGRSNLLLAIFPFPKSENFSPIKARTVIDLRGNMCDIKSINLLHSVLASTGGEGTGFEESVYVRDGIVLECAHSSIARVKDGVLYTPPLSPRILPGITRSAALRICKELDIAYKEIYFSKEELYKADEVLILSTTKFCRWVSLLDDVRFARSQAKIGRIIFENLSKKYNLH